MEMYNHKENQIDPRDKNLVSYSPKSKWFVVEASDLKGAGIEPISHNYLIGGNTYVIFIWSEKYQLPICYRYNKSSRNNDGEVIADIFLPYFDSIYTNKQALALTDSLGTELHILND